MKFIIQQEREIAEFGGTDLENFSLLAKKGKYVAIIVFYNPNDGSYSSQYAKKEGECVLDPDDWPH
jgi:hypothetical protein